MKNLFLNEECKGFKKGTMHFEFLDEDVWFKFNYE